MRKLMVAAAMVIACGLLSGSALLQERGGEDETGPYEVVPNWPQPLEVVDALANTQRRPRALAAQ